jgi:hypothetical protein
MTSEALITAEADWPAASLSSSTASLVIEAVMMEPPPNANVGGRLSLLHLDDLALENVARAELHGDLPVALI